MRLKASVAQRAPRGVERHVFRRIVRVADMCPLETERRQRLRRGQKKARSRQFAQVVLPRREHAGDAAQSDITRIVGHVYL